MKNKKKFILSFEYVFFSCKCQFKELIPLVLKKTMKEVNSLYSNTGFLCLVRDRLSKSSKGVLFISLSLVHIC